MRRRALLTAVLFLTGSVCLAADPPPAPAPALTPDQQAANRALGQRIAQQAQLSLGSGSITPEAIRFSATMLETAAKLDPTEPRNYRLLVEAYLQIGGDEGREGAIKALTRYLQLEPTDQGAQLRMINLHFSQIQAADQQAKYVEQLLATPSIAPEVRAQIAMMGAKLAVDRLEREQARQYVEQALKLFPLCPEALRQKYLHLDENTPPAPRLALLLQVLRSNPGQPDVMAEIAGQLARAGLMDPAQNWYMQSFALSARMGGTPDAEDILGYISELVIADQHRAADPWIKGLREQDPTNSDVAFLELLIARRAKAQDRIDSATQDVQRTLEARLSRISDVINNREQPGNFDLTADIKKLNELTRLDLTTGYAASLADLAWLKIHFQSNTADAQPYLAALRQVLSPDSITLARLEGWAYLVDSKAEEARVKLSAVAGRDPLAALGMIRLDSADQPAEKIIADARKLLVANASGMVGAMLIESLRDKIALMPLGPDAAAMRAELDAFPMKWLEILDLNTARNFYQLKAEPVNIMHKFGEPILARVSITNISTHDITMSPDGALKPDVWIDVRLSRPEQRTIPGVAYDRITYRLVLKPNETVTQIMRVDAAGVVPVLATNPTMDIPLYYAVLTNPMTQSAGIVPGPGGYRAQFLRVPVRNASPLLADTLPSVNAILQNGAGDAKVRTLELLGTYATLLRGVADPNVQGKSAEFIDIIRKSTGDPNPAVRAQAMLTTAALSEPEVRSAMIRQMLSDESFPIRALGVAAVNSIPDAAANREFVQPLAQNDPDPVIKAMGAALLAVPAHSPSTQPADPATASGGPIPAPAAGGVDP